MSKLIVEVCAIDAVLPHTNADALELCIVKGWQCVSQKGRRQAGDKIVYVPTDAMVPLPLADSLGVTKYLGGVTADRTAGRVRCAKLRGEPSFGIIMECADPAWSIGDDVADFYGITKYEPAIKLCAGDAERPHALLPRYTEIENLRNFPYVFEDSDPVVLTEKVHGTNCKIGIIEGEWMASSMDVRRKRPADEQMAGNIYWFPYTIDGVRGYVEQAAAGGAKQVLVFGEVYGKVQSLSYDRPGRLGFVAFDIMIEGKYLDYGDFVTACDAFGIPRAPEIASGPFSLAWVKSHAGGKSTFAEHIREGVVVKPLVERIHPKVGRLAMKYISDQYLLKKEDGKVTDTTEV